MQIGRKHLKLTVSQDQTPRRAGFALFIGGQSPNAHRRMNAPERKEQGRPTLWGFAAGDVDLTATSIIKGSAADKGVSQVRSRSRL
jgi:hypothetical protein